MSVLNVSEIPIKYFIYPPISVVGNEIWAGRSVPVIWFLDIIFPNEADISFVSSIILMSQVRNDLQVFCSIVLINFCWILHLPHFAVINFMIFLTIFLTTIFFCCIILSLSMVMYKMFSKCTVLYSIHAEIFSESLLQLSI